MRSSLEHRRPRADARPTSLITRRLILVLASLGMGLPAFGGPALQESTPLPTAEPSRIRDVEPAPPPPAATVFRVTLAPEVADQARLVLQSDRKAQARLLVLLCERNGRMRREDPLSAPFFQRPQPILSIPVAASEITAGQVFLLGSDQPETVMVPDRLDRLNGRFLARAVLDLGLDRSHDAAGNPISQSKEIVFRAGTTQVFDLTIDSVIPEDPLPQRTNLKWVELDSPILSKALDRPVSHRAGVAFPPAYFDIDADRRFWPVIYVIPGFGGDHRDASRFARMLDDPSMREVLPQAIWIVLDPEDRLGHHGFVDSDNFGPRSTALVEEFIPWLEHRFRLVSSPEARFLTGHSSGGWSSLWLQLEHPEFFGGCFSSAPDPVDFTAFGTVDLTSDETLFTDADGLLQPSYRAPLTEAQDHVMMTIEEEIAMERALAPDFTSGEQWGAWNAMFSGRDSSSGLPLAAFDLETGVIDRTVIDRDWSRYDVARLVREDPDLYGPILRDRVRLICGDADSYYLNRAVERLMEISTAARAGLEEPEGPGYVELAPGATHGSVVPLAIRRFYPELRRLAEQAPAS
ncbi:MAG: alpha/beta hydrolase-fold protein [Phycisphaerales bacterium]|nr:alpha/beta hydrolase-fold protein [Phycisphaerales bacterium]